jgi:hypothetical protein
MCIPGGQFDVIPLYRLQQENLISAVVYTTHKQSHCGCQCVLGLVTSIMWRVWLLAEHIQAEREAIMHITGNLSHLYSLLSMIPLENGAFGSQHGNVMTNP